MIHVIREIEKPLKVYFSPYYRFYYQALIETGHGEPINIPVNTMLVPSGLV